MALTNAFYDAVNRRDVGLVRVMMKDSLLVDPTFSRFNEMLNATKSLDGLYDEHDGRELKSDRTEWNDDYMNMLMVQVVGNFSRERLEHLKQVVRYLRPVAETQPGNGRTNYPPAPISGRDGDSSGRDDSYEKIAIGAAAGAVVGGVIAAVAEVTVLGGVIIGAIGGAVCGAVIGKGDE